MLLHVTRQYLSTLQLQFQAGQFGPTIQGYWICPKIAVDIALCRTIIRPLCQKSSHAGCPPVHRLLFMFSDQSNMPTADNQTRDSYASAAHLHSVG
jgi:hypothetical protein